MLNYQRVGSEPGRRRSLTAAGVTGSDGLPAVWLAVMAPKLGTWTGTAATMPLEIKESQVKLGVYTFVGFGHGTDRWPRKKLGKLSSRLHHIYMYIYIYIFGFLSCRVSKNPFATEEVSSQSAMHPTSRISQKFVQQIMLKWYPIEYPIYIMIIYIYIYISHYWWS